MAKATSFPPADAAGKRLMLSGADALGPNPWITPRPEPQRFGLLNASDLDEEAVAQNLKAAKIELKQRGARVISSYLLPLTAFGAAYYVLVGPVVEPPPYEWVAYLGASLILAAVTAKLQMRRHARVLETQERLTTLDERRMTFRAKEREWVDEQRKRTTTKFWADEIPKIAAAKGVPVANAFAQEVGKLFVAWGWMVKLNQRAGDHGVDIVTTGKEGSAVVLCSHADAGPSAGDVRDLAGSRQAFDADYGLLVSLYPPAPIRTAEAERGHVEFWHLGHILEQCMVLYKQRTGEDAPSDVTRGQFLNADGTPIAIAESQLEAAE